MKYRGKDVFVPKWISCRSYFFGKDKSRTYISDEKSHSYILLEGLASDMWKLLCDNASELDLWARDNSIANEIEGFLSQLAEQGLIVFGQESNSQAIEDYQPMDKTATKEEKAFVEEMQEWFMKNDLLYSLFFELTYRCDLKCVHCYNPKNMSSVEIDFDQCKKAIDDAYDCGCFKIIFSGGESSLHSNFSKLIAYARGKRMSVEIFTNGQTISQNSDLYKEIIGLYPYRICLSLYSTDKNMHERVTSVDGSFENTFSLINRLRKDNVNVQIKNFLLNFNCRDCIKVKETAERIGASSAADISLIPTIEGDKKTLQYALDEDALFELYTDEKSPLYIGKNYAGWTDLEARKKDAPCLGGFTGLCVNPNGEVVICVSLPYSVGDLKESSVKSIWQSAVNKDSSSKLYQWQSKTIADFKECYNNDYCRFCNLCPGMGYLENGSFSKSNVLCIQAKAKKKAYEYLYSKG